MTGIVVVSHSRPLAEAAAALAAQMLGGDGPRIEVAAGLSDTELGTDAVAIQEAIERAADDQGVLVLMDLGSALMSAEMAVEMLDPQLAGRVRLSPAPLVEGLVGAAAVAAGGADLERAAAEADVAVEAKRTHLASLSDG